MNEKIVIIYSTEHFYLFSFLWSPSKHTFKYITKLPFLPIRKNMVFFGKLPQLPYLSIQPANPTIYWEFTIVRPFHDYYLNEFFKKPFYSWDDNNTHVIIWACSVPRTSTKKQLGPPRQSPALCGILSISRSLCHLVTCSCQHTLPEVLGVSKQLWGGPAWHSQGSKGKASEG